MTVEINLPFYYRKINDSTVIGFIKKKDYIDLDIELDLSISKFFRKDLFNKAEEISNNPSFIKEIEELKQEDIHIFILIKSKLLDNISENIDIPLYENIVVLINTKEINTYCLDLRIDLINYLNTLRLIENEDVFQGYINCSIKEYTLLLFINKDNSWSFYIPHSIDLVFPYSNKIDSADELVSKACIKVIKKKEQCPNPLVKIEPICKVKVFTRSQGNLFIVKEKILVTYVRTRVREVRLLDPPKGISNLVIDKECNVDLLTNKTLDIETVINWFNEAMSSEALYDLNKHKFELINPEEVDAYNHIYRRVY